MHTTSEPEGAVGSYYGETLRLGAEGTYDRVEDRPDGLRRTSGTYAVNGTEVTFQRPCRSRCAAVVTEAREAHVRSHARRIIFAYDDGYANGKEAAHFTFVKK